MAARISLLSLNFFLLLIAFSAYSRDRVSNDSPQNGKKTPETTDSTNNINVGYPVMLYNDTLFWIYENLGPFTAEERAEKISDRIGEVAAATFYSPDSLKVLTVGELRGIVYGKNILITVSESDAKANHLPIEQLVSSFRKIIDAAIINYREETSSSTILKDIGIALLLVIFVLIVIKVINLVFNIFRRRLIALKGSELKGIRIGNYQLLNADREIALILFIYSAVRIIVILISIYLALPLLFGLFPWTMSFAKILISYFVSPLKSILLSFWDYIPNLITIVVIIAVTHYFLKGLRFFKSEIENGALKIKGFYPDYASPTFSIVRVLSYAFTLVVVFPYLPGSESPVFQGISVFLGILFSFGSAGALSSLISGMVLTYMRAYKIGDRVKINDITGDIIEKSLLVTRIRTIKNEEVTIPNSNVLNSHTINYSNAALLEGLILNTTVTIGYDAPWRTVHDLLINAALSTNGIIPEPKPFVLQTSLDDFYISYQINAYTKDTPNMVNIYSDLHQNIQDKFNEAGVEIMSPHYNSLRDGNSTAIPSSYLPKNYEAAGFKIEPGDKGK